MKVCFNCHTLYQLFVDYLISMTYYYEDEKILIINDNSQAVCNILDNIKKIGIWNNIIIIKENGSTDEEIYQQLQFIKLYDIDIIHFFAPWGARVARILINLIDFNTKLILTDDGSATYNPVYSWKINYQSYGKYYEESKINMLFDINIFKEL